MRIIPRRPATPLAAGCSRSAPPIAVLWGRGHAADPPRQAGSGYAYIGALISTRVHGARWLHERRPSLQVSCGGTGAECYARAAEICPEGYDTVNPYERRMMVRCK